MMINKIFSIVVIVCQKICMSNGLETCLTWYFLELDFVTDSKKEKEEEEDLAGEGERFIYLFLNHKSTSISFFSIHCLINFFFLAGIFQSIAC